jgi:hypothetical protein
MLKLFPLFSPFSFSFALTPPTFPLCDPDPSACMTAFSGAFAGSSDRATSAAALTKDAAAATPGPAKVAAAAPTNATSPSIGTPPMPSPATTGAAPPSPPLQLPSPWLPPPREEKEESPVTAGASPPRDDDDDDGSTHAQATLVQLSRRLVWVRDFLFGELW